jgi:hypothetical protein
MLVSLIFSRLAFTAIICPLFTLAAFGEGTVTDRTAGFILADFNCAAILLAVF